jgi:hypothetical protein
MATVSATEWSALSPDARAKGYDERERCERALRYRFDALSECLQRQGFTATQAAERARAVLEEAIEGRGKR